MDYFQPFFFFPGILRPGGGLPQKRSKRSSEGSLPNRVITLLRNEPRNKPQINAIISWCAPAKMLVQKTTTKASSWILLALEAFFAPIRKPKRSSFLMEAKYSPHHSTTLMASLNDEAYVQTKALPRNHLVLSYATTQEIPTASRTSFAQYFIFKVLLSVSAHTLSFIADLLFRLIHRKNFCPLSSLSSVPRT